MAIAFEKFVSEQERIKKKISAQYFLSKTKGYGVTRDPFSGHLLVR
jgi:hypothetical protein